MGSLFSSDVSAIVFNDTKHTICYSLSTDKMTTVEEVIELESKISVDIYPLGFGFTSPKKIQTKQLLHDERFFPCYPQDFSRESLQSKDKIRPGTMISFYQMQKFAGKNKDRQRIHIGDGNLPKGTRVFLITECEEECKIKTLVGFQDIFTHVKKYDCKSLGDTITGLIQRLWTKLSQHQKQIVKEKDPEFYKLFS